MEAVTASTARYSAPARALHWASAIAVLILLPVGVAMVNRGEGPVTNALYEWHKSIGLLALAIVLVRLAVRLGWGAPPAAPILTPLEHFAATWTHRGLYALLLVMPILGWVGTSMCCAPVMWFGTVPVTLPISGGEATTNAVFLLHKLGALALTLLVLLHLAGVIVHGVIRKDGVVGRMI